jgi:hypothetical protein
VCVPGGKFAILTLSQPIICRHIGTAQLYGTLLQPFTVLFFVYWWWHRLDISFDAIVKYFASGFFICTGISIIYEMIASVVVSLAISIITILGTVGMILAGTIDLDDAIDIGSNDDVKQSTFSTIDVPIPYKLCLALITAFLNAFFVAAMVEELGKYLCFWMVEHPDLTQDRVMLPSISETNALVSEEATEATKLHNRDATTLAEIGGGDIFAPKASFVSLGAAITIAMMTVSLRWFCFLGGSTLFLTFFENALADCFGICVCRKSTICLHLFSAGFE